MILDDQVTSKREIPPSEFGYVCATDSFMSGWGPAQGLTNRLIFVCESREDARILIENCEARKELKRVTWCKEKPSLRRGNLYQLKTKEDSPNFYKTGYFK